MKFDLRFIEALCSKNVFLRWRAERLGFPGLAEKPEQSPPESLLQQVWRYQRLIHEKLQTTDGPGVRILHPGFWNKEPGPDFRRAVIQIGTDGPITGDVEIDIVPGGWRQHAHASNPNYGGVILHVTWEPASTKGYLPTLCLKHALDSTVPELSFWLGLEPKPAPEGLAGQCSGPLRSLDPVVVKDVLKQAAQARLLQKAEQIQARARQAGWDAALWEGLFAALGYKRNVWPMRRLAELKPLLARDVPEALEGVMLLQARCFGVAGLLPADARTGKNAGTYIRSIWDIWWREADSFCDHIFSQSMWNLGGIRPANHPQRRVALAAHWLLRHDLASKLEGWLARQIERPDLIGSLENILQVREDDFWSYRWTWNSKPFAQPQSLLGEQRITDLAVNVILPWLYVRACAGANHSLAKTAEARYFLWPSGEDNSILRLARQRLFGGVSAKFLKTAAAQQGLLQIVRDFCDHSNAVCHNCQFPDLLLRSSSSSMMH